MPTYSYRCNKCKVEFDTVQRMSDDKLTQCKDCKTETLERIITSTNGFELKGKGWFKSGGY
jgi:putative FmdB family regulatory protein